jgi:hypothetical protein
MATGTGTAAPIAAPVAPPVPVWMQALSLFLQTAPAVEGEIAAAMQQHWGKDHVQQIAMGASVLTQVAGTVASVVAAQGGPAPQPAA